MTFQTVQFGGSAGEGKTFGRTAVRGGGRAGRLQRHPDRVRTLHTEILQRSVGRVPQ